MSQLARINDLFQDNQNMSQSLQQQWWGIFSRHRLPWMMRVKLASWIESQEWFDCSEQEARHLWEEMLKSLLAEIEKEETFLQMSQKHEMDQLQTQYQFNVHDFTKAVHACLEEEKSLIEDIQKTSDEMSCVAMEITDQAHQEILKALSQLGPKLQVLRRSMLELKSKEDEYNMKQDLHNKQRMELTEMEDGLQQLQQEKKQNGLSMEMLIQKKNKCLDFEAKKTSSEQLVEKQRTQAQLDFNALVELLSTALILVLEEVEKWKKEQVLMHMVCLREESVSLNQLADWCAKLGDILYNTWSETNDHNDLYDVEDIQKKLMDLIQQTFVVSRQPCNVWKIEGNTTKKFKCSKEKAEVRILALEKLEQILVASKVAAVFCHEQFINNCSDTQSRLEDHCFPLEDKKEVHFQKSKSRTNCYIGAQFNNLKLSKFERTGSKKQVCEEKYRLVFKTVISTFQFCPGLEVISMPIIVTTASNQWCAAQGSLLWQAFSTDMSSVPIVEPPDKLPWPKVAEMLVAKLKVVNSDRNLRPEQLKHLAYKLTGKGLPDFSDVEIQFSRFCLEKMDGRGKKQFEFWKWFLSIVNLIKKYPCITEFWNDGLIEGFISKDNAKKRLLDEQIPVGTILLRFSDQCVSHDQGEDLCGAISVAEKVRKSEVQFPEPLTDERLKSKSLALWLLSWMNKKTMSQQFTSVYKHEATEKFVQLDYLMKFTSEESIQSTQMTAEGYIRNDICLVTEGLSDLSMWSSDENQSNAVRFDAAGICIPSALCIRSSPLGTLTSGFHTSQPDSNQQNSSVAGQKLSLKRNSAGISPDSPSNKTLRVDNLTVTMSPPVSPASSGQYPCITGLLTGQTSSPSHEFETPALQNKQFSIAEYPNAQSEGQILSIPKPASFQPLSPSSVTATAVSDLSSVTSQCRSCPTLMSQISSATASPAGASTVQVTGNQQNTILIPLQMTADSDRVYYVSQDMFMQPEANITLAGDTLSCSQENPGSIQIISFPVGSDPCQNMPDWSSLQVQKDEAVVEADGGVQDGVLADLEPPPSPFITTDDMDFLDHQNGVDASALLRRDDPVWSTVSQNNASTLPLEEVDFTDLSP